MTWSDGYVLGYEPMDEVHREFVDCVGALQQCADAGVQEALDRVIEHLQSHFDAEDELMLRYDFPPRECHIDEHAAVLHSAKEVRQRVARGDCAQARHFADALADWFPGHATHLDSALAHWMVKRLHGGKPLVFRRLQSMDENSGVRDV
jgi:hemerythrin-like metal-binding protein